MREAGLLHAGLNLPHAGLLGRSHVAPLSVPCIRDCLSRMQQSISAGDIVSRESVVSDGEGATWLPQVSWERGSPLLSEVQLCAEVFAPAQLSCGSHLAPTCMPHVSGKRMSPALSFCLALVRALVLCGRVRNYSPALLGHLCGSQVAPATASCSMQRCCRHLPPMQRCCCHVQVAMLLPSVRHASVAVVCVYAGELSPAWLLA